MAGEAVLIVTERFFLAHPACWNRVKARLTIRRRCRFSTGVEPDLRLPWWTEGVRSADIPGPRRWWPSGM
jgi:hypothetical protein